MEVGFEPWETTSYNYIYKIKMFLPCEIVKFRFVDYMDVIFLCFVTKILIFVNI